MTLLRSRPLARWSLAALLGLGLCLGAAAGRAAAASGVTVAIPGGATMTVSDVNPQPGDDVTVGFDYAVPAGGSAAGLDTYLDSESPVFGAGLVNAVCVAGGNVATISCVQNSAQAQVIDVAFTHALAGGESASWSITYTVTAASGTAFALLAVFPDGPSPLVDVVVGSPPQADAAVGLTARPQFGLLTPALVYTVKLTDNGPAALDSATVTTSLPAGLTPTAGGACTAGSGQAVCVFPALAAGASETVSFSVPLRLLTIGVSERATALITAASPADPVASNNSSTVSCTYLGGLLASCG